MNIQIFKMKKIKTFLNKNNKIIYKQINFKKLVPKIKLINQILYKNKIKMNKIIKNTNKKIFKKKLEILNNNQINRIKIAKNNKFSKKITKIINKM